MKGALLVYSVFRDIWFLSFRPNTPLRHSIMYGEAAIGADFSLVRFVPIKGAPLVYSVVCYIVSLFSPKCTTASLHNVRVSRDWLHFALFRDVFTFVLPPQKLSSGGVAGAGTGECLMEHFASEAKPREIPLPWCG